MMQWRLVSILAMLLSLSGVAAGASGAGESAHWQFPKTVPLPQTASIGTQFVYKQFHVLPATSKDLAGKSTHGIPAKVVTVLDGTGSWDGPSAVPPPAYVVNGSVSMRNEVALFQVETGLGGGWIAVPRGWRVISAVAGAQGSWEATFIAPDGPSHGWLSVGGSGPGTTEVFSAAEGYFPGAYRLENEIIPGALTRDSVLSPEPDSLVHPDPCTALVSYKSDGLAVKSIRQFGRDTDGVTSFSIALPAAQETLQTFLFRVYRKEHPVLSCMKNVSDW
jgi:hypothetical protein